jgi:hypothetical protein
MGVRFPAFDPSPKLPFSFLFCHISKIISRFFASLCGCFWGSDLLNFDGFAKNPAEAHLRVRLTPQFLRAWHLELLTKSSFQ